VLTNPNLPVHGDNPGPTQQQRLKSRRIQFSIASDLTASGFDSVAEWVEGWTSQAPPEWQSLMILPGKPPGFDLPRRLWSCLNRVRTNHGVCAAALAMWGAATSAACDCGADSQTVKHIAFECPIRAYEGEMKDFIDVTPDVIDWMNQLDLKL
jgi:hypothetical protein